MPEPTAMAFGQLLRQRRSDAELTQEELARTTGLSARAISDLERGVNHAPRASTIRLLADALGLAGPARAEFAAIAQGRAPMAGPSAGGVASATRALPRDVASFTGRQAKLQELASAVPGGSSQNGTVSVQVIGGMAGVGKTAFAVHAAHWLALRFPDGQIFLPLHGHTPGQRPVAPADALVSLLQTAGLAAQQIPAGLAARTALWRDRVSGKRLLLVLDDASDSQQVRPLLPAASGSLVLITSRRHLTALEDARAVSLDTLPAGEAATLLARLAGRPGLEPEDPAVAQIARLCGHLPLAIGMLARQLHHHPAWTPADLAADLAAAQDRLGLMTAENLSVAAAFDLSYQDLTGDQRRLFRRLGLHPGSDIDSRAAAALDDTDAATAHRALTALYDQYLLSEPSRGRYRMHDLIREHAHALAGQHDQGDDKGRATSRLLGYYQRAAEAADRRLTRHTRPPTAPAAAPGAPPGSADMPGRAQALAWLRAERANLLACLDHAARSGQYPRVAALTAAMAALLRHDGPWSDAITRHSAAVQAAQRAGDAPAEANARHDLGITERLTGDYPAATRSLTAALGIYRDAGNRLGQANVLNDLGMVRYATDDYQDATAALEEALCLYHDPEDQLGQANARTNLGKVRLESGDYPGTAAALEEALRLYRGLGDRVGQANALTNLGALRRRTGYYAGAAQALGEATGIFRDLGDRLNTGLALGELGSIRSRTGDYPGAADVLQEALDILRSLGNKQGQSFTLGILGGVWRRAGDYPAAARALQDALDSCRSIGDRGSEAELLNETGALHRLRGDLARSVACHQQARQLAVEIESAWDEAHALAGLARCALAAGRRADAQASLEQARDIFRRIGAAEIGEISAELDELSRP